jgi:hypothetical protein
MSGLDHPLHCDCAECVSSGPRYAGRRGTARSLFEQLARRGVSFRIVDGKVRFGPGRLLTDDERSELRRVKDEIRTLIEEDDERRARGEAYIRDQGVAFEEAREIMSKTQRRSVERIQG